MREVLIGLFVIGVASVAGQDPDELHDDPNPAQPVAVEPELTG